MPVVIYFVSSLIVLAGVISPFSFVFRNAGDFISLMHEFERRPAVRESRYQAPERHYIAPLSEYSYPIRNWSLDEPYLNVRSALSVDAESEKILFGKEENRRVPIASLTKIMSAVVILEQLDLSDSVTVSSRAIERSFAQGGSRELYEGETFYAEDLLRLMLIKSNNEAAFAFEEYAAEKDIDLVHEMNKKAVELGMYDTFFNDPAGLDDERGFSTAADLAKLIIYSLKYDIIHAILRTPDETIISQDNSIVHRIFSTNRLLGLLPNLITGKTGYTEGALGNMAVVVRSPSGSNVVNVVLGSNERFRETTKLIEWVTAAYIWE